MQAFLGSCVPVREKKSPIGLTSLRASLAPQEPRQQKRTRDEVQRRRSTAYEMPCLYSEGFGLRCQLSFGQVKATLRRQTPLEDPASGFPASSRHRVGDSRALFTTDSRKVRSMGARLGKSFSTIQYNEIRGLERMLPYGHYSTGQRSKSLSDYRCKKT